MSNHDCKDRGSLCQNEEKVSKSFGKLSKFVTAWFRQQGLTIITN